MLKKHHLERVIHSLRYIQDSGVKYTSWDPSAVAELKAIAKSITLAAPTPTPQAASPRRAAKPPVIKIDFDYAPAAPVVEAEPEKPISNLPPPPEIILPEGDKQSQLDWLRDRVLNCPECNKHLKPGKKLVFGTGNINADILFCGEAPGEDEESQGEPFVGKPGQLLTKIIQATGLKRDDVYMANIMNWRPEMPTPFGNRAPTQEDMNFCLPFLKAQLQIIQPKVIVALGATTVNGLLGHDKKRKMSDVRGKWHKFQSIPLMITFHPSYLLRNQSKRTKRTTWEDFMLVMGKVSLPISDKQRKFFL